jgi:hypothetical protein
MKVKHGSFVMTNPKLDADLQDAEQANEMTLKMQVQAKIEAARRKALEMLNANLKEILKDQSFAFEWTDFMMSQTGIDKSTGKRIACEWKASKVKGHGNSQVTVFAVIDIDDIPPGAAVNGPDRPHVGFSFWGNGAVANKHIARQNGHVFVNYVHVSRNT